METILGPEFEGGSDLSVGQWQRVALGRAFFRLAPFVILDEPTAALDPRAEHDLFERIRALLAGRPVLLISHRFSSVRNADRIYVLQSGRVTEAGTHTELMGQKATMPNSSSYKQRHTLPVTKPTSTQVPHGLHRLQPAQTVRKVRERSFPTPVLGVLPTAITSWADCAAGTLHNPHN